jgi:putative phosphoribosyl transferase
MLRHFRPIFQSREEAGKLLSKKLIDHKPENAIIMGIPPAGLIVAAAIAEEVHLPLHVLPCRKIRHPSISGKSIGSVSADEIFIEDNNHDLPRDYIYHQVAMLRSVIGFEQGFYNDRDGFSALKGKDVIVVDEFVEHSGCMQACIHSIMKFGPRRIIVAVPVISINAFKDLSGMINEVVSLYQESTVPSVFTCYQENEYPQEDLIKAMFDHANGLTTA